MLKESVAQAEALHQQAQQEFTSAKSTLALHQTKQMTCQEKLEAKQAKLQLFPDE